MLFYALERRRTSRSIKNEMVEKQKSNARLKITSCARAGVCVCLCVRVWVCVRARAAHVCIVRACVRVCV